MNDPSGKKRVMILEEDDHLCRALARLIRIKNKGVEIISMKQRVEAFHAIRMKPDRFDLLIVGLDHNQPYKVFTDKIAKICGSKLRVILFTNGNDPDPKLISIPKPDAGTLMQKVGELLAP